MTLNCVKPKPCKPDTETPSVYPPATPAFSLCLFGNKLEWDGTRLTLTQTFSPEDGEYSTLTVKNGCVVALGHCPEPLYTPPFCASEPQPCGNSGSSLAVSKQAGNLLQVKSDGLYATVYINASDGQRLKGTGSASDPYVLPSPSVVGGSTTLKGGTGIEVTGNGSKKTINLEKLSGYTSGTYRGLKFDDYGRFVGESTTTDSFVSSITASNGIDSVTVDGVTSLALTKSDIGIGSYDLGGYTITFGYGGRATNLEKRVLVEEGVYPLGAYLLTISELGHIEDIKQSDAIPNGAGFFLTKDDKKVSYDESGRITKIEVVETEE